MNTKVLVTGGAGYIGSHACVALLSAGYELVVLDNMSNGCPAALARVSQITGKTFDVVEGDVRDPALLDNMFASHAIGAVMHFAGLKAVGESCAEPLLYYDVNVGGTLNLCRVMREHGVGNLVFSSSATVYGDPVTLPIPEDHGLNPTNPYGCTKKVVEDVLSDLVRADESLHKPFWHIAVLRYFNPIGAHYSGHIGEAPHGIPNNLLPYIAQVAGGKLDTLMVYGNDWPTDDGTGVRDYVHVMDLVEGHLCALRKLMQGGKHGCSVWNLGTGIGYSVLQMISAFETTSGKAVPYRIAGRRPGDIAACWADPAKAKRELDWVAQRSLEQMISDSWRWQKTNPDGYE